MTGEIIKVGHRGGGGNGKIEVRGHGSRSEVSITINLVLMSSELFSNVELLFYEKGGLLVRDLIAISTKISASNHSGIIGWSLHLHGEVQTLICVIFFILASGGTSTAKFHWK